MGLFKIFLSLFPIFFRVEKSRYRKRSFARKWNLVIWVKIIELMIHIGQNATSNFITLFEYDIDVNEIIFQSITKKENFPNKLPEPLKSIRSWSNFVILDWTFPRRSIWQPEISYRFVESKWIQARKETKWDVGDGVRNSSWCVTLRKSLRLCCTGRPEVLQKAFHIFDVVQGWEQREEKEVDANNSRRPTRHNGLLWKPKAQRLWFIIKLAIYRLEYS